MRVTQSTPEMLVLKHTPRVLPAVCFGSALAMVYLAHERIGDPWSADAAGAVVGIAVFLAAGILVSRRSRFVFEAARGQLRWEHRGLFRSSAGTVSFSGIRAVSIEPEPLESAGGSFRVVLETSDGPVPLTPHYSGVEPHEENARAIRAWLTDRGVGVSAG